ncbi:MAG: DUF3107 family protein [Actinobacteria bacterium]|jgi:hypothetical protein|nr:DUF3107 family protein [Actinomycetota bacterium]MBU1493806.1 DUF3107 family protein [Actinomycetota bacterium]MBU1865538.1 DUF3107 family protein [Actinomycetota bacterium]
MAPREVEVDVDDGEALAAEIERAISEGQALVRVTDRSGVQHGLVTDKIAFFELEPKGPKAGIGFSTA